MSVQENVRLDEQFIATWSSHDADRAVELLSDDAVWEDVASPERMRDKAAIRAYMQGWFTAFPDMKATVKNRVVTDDQVASEVEFTGTNTGPMQMGTGTPSIPPTGKRITGRGTYFLRIRNGKITEAHSYPDVFGLMMQLGLVPPPKG
ncbi:MAG: ester cyclase [Dehalococcoidia bacterium]|nr:ester cyclase [Dehalococcoidia bacterium]